MATRNYVWRTAPTGTEGTATVYVDSEWGSDVFGNGTRSKPYQSLTKAWVQASTKPSKIICKGIFSEQIANGNHSAAIQGDYYGAAVFDGAGTYVIYGFTHYNMIFRNVPPGRGDEQVYSGSGLLAGVGCANHASTVGFASYVLGVAGSSVSMHRSALYMGFMGSSTAAEKVVYDSPVHNSSYLLSLGGYNDAQFLTDGVVFNVAVEDRVKCSYGKTVVNTIFSKFAMIGNEKRKITFTRCVFAADVKWYWLSADNGVTGTVTELTLTGETSAARQEDLLSQLTTLGLSSSLMPVFNDCVFSGETYNQIFNDADNGDFTLIPGCDADFGNGNHCGALPPALHIPILHDSTGVAGSWDERSVSGCLSVLSVDVNDNHAFIAIDTDSTSEQGEMVSKIIAIDPTKVQLSSVWSELVSHIGSYGVKMWKENVIGEDFDPGDTLPQGIYVVRGSGSVTYGEHTVSPGRTIYVTEDNTTFGLDDAQFPSVLAEVTDPSIADVLYCRCRSVVYARVGVTDDLQRGATYYNDGNLNITYHNRTIAPGESFFCMIGGERFTCSDNDYKIAVMFDDTRVPASEWIPAAAMQRYFVGKMSGAILVDSYGIPLASGNPRAYQQAVAKSYMDRRYVQFCVKVKRYGNITVD